MRRLLASLLVVPLVPLAACVHSSTPAAPSSDDPAGAADALAHKDGPFAVDADGRWQPILDASVRFVADPGAQVSLLALDLNKDAVAVAIRHTGRVSLAGDPVASGEGVTIVALDAAGKLRWKVGFSGGKIEIERLRLSSDGAIAVAGKAAPGVSVDVGKLSERPADKDGFIYVIDAEGRTARSRGESQRPGERTLAVDAHAYDEVLEAGELPESRRGGDRWQAFVELSLLHEGSHRQVFGSDQPIRVIGVDAGFPGWNLVTGSFEGSLAAGGRTPIVSEQRTPFVAAVQSSGKISWLAPIFPPARGVTLEPVGLTADEHGVHLGLAATGVDGSSAVIGALLDGDGSVIGSCELTRSARLHALTFAGDLTVLVGRFEAGGAPSSARFYGEGCKTLARFDAPTGERLVAVRPVDERILVGVDVGAGAAAELRWYRK